MTTPTPYLTALITLNLPGTHQATQVTVKLLPADMVDTTHGRKQLGDCTLSELAQYADQLEQTVQADYANIRLRELTEQPDHQIHIALLDKGQPDTTLPMAAGLAYMVADSTTIATETPAAAAETLVPIEEIPTPDNLPAEPDQTDAHEDNEPAIHVAEPESVFEEREAGTPPTGTVAGLSEKQKMRIAGLRRPIHHPTWAAVDILINENAFRDSQAHALSSMDREVAGVLVGPPPEKQPDGRYVVHITDTIIAKHTRMHGASVTYTPESWRYLNDKLYEMYPDDSAVMVGWYHTHPGFGIFLSGMDLFIHQNFFTQVWHVALVLDPVARTSGFFCWDRPKTRVDRYDFPWPYWAHKGW
ncbi:MAG: hypothetical protein KA314_03670 [Chloroflexi bacterium]|nr:hypothetical protein [Chloroflexota bacterium]MBP8054912.1 hypothetical protein [Chloroflexota bacterium]